MDNRISLQKLEIFCLVVELGGVSRAAEHLQVAQPVVSSHLKMLQERVHGELFERQGRGLRLTECGEVAYAWAKDVLSQTQEVTRAIEGIADGDVGHASISASMTMGSYVLPPIITDFLKQHDRARVTLRVSDLTGALNDVETGISDFCVVASNQPIRLTTFETEQIAVEELILVRSPTDEQVGARVAVEELESLSFVCAPPGLTGRHLVDGCLRDLGVYRRNVNVELGHPEALKHATRRGLGVAMVLRSCVQTELREGSLVVVEIEGVRIELPVLLVKRASKRWSALQSRLADAIRAGAEGQMPTMHRVVRASAVR